MSRKDVPFWEESNGCRPTAVIVFLRGVETDTTVASGILGILRARSPRRRVIDVLERHAQVKPTAPLQRIIKARALHVVERSAMRLVSLGLHCTYKPGNAALPGSGKCKISLCVAVAGVESDIIPLRRGYKSSGARFRS